MIEIAKRKLVDTKVDNLQLEVNSIEFFDRSEQYDAILALCVLHLLDGPVKNIQKTHQRLKPNDI